MQAAEALNPIRIQLYDLYSDLLLDGVLTNLIDKRILGVTKTKLAFFDSTGKEVDEIKTLIGLQQFRKLRREIMLQKIYGISVIELMRVNNVFKIFSAPRKHIKPNIGKITFEQYGSDGIDYRKPPHNKFIVEIGESEDLGLLLRAAPYIIYKRGGFGDWAHFAEIFGMPFREARYSGYNDNVRAQLEIALEQAGSASYAILPKEAEIKFHDSKSTQGSSDLYNTLRRACNEELCILFVGQTETTTSSSSSGYAQSQTHADVETSINEDDREDELSVLNEKILPILSLLGYKVEGGRFAHVPVEEQLTAKEKSEIIIKLKNEAELPISDDYLYESFNIPKPDNYNEIKATTEQNKKEAKEPLKKEPTKQNNPANKSTTKEEEEEEEEEDIKLSIWYKLRAYLADFFDPAP